LGLGSTVGSIWRGNPPITAMGAWLGLVNNK